MPTKVQSKWTPHPGQREILESLARFKIAACGRRFGKTVMARHDAFQRGWENPGANIWWVSPTYNDSNELGYDGLERMIPDSLIANRVRSEPRILELTNGTRFSFRTTDREDSLRGRSLDHVVVDEAGSTPDHAWQAELRPALMDNEGTMLAIGTPKRDNWFKSWYARGQDPDRVDTESWQMPSYTNPHVSDDEIRDTESQLPERTARQEIHAEFVDDTGGVFTGVTDCVATRDGERLDPESYWASLKPVPPYVCGVDLGRADAYTVVTVLDSRGRLCAFERVRQQSWNRIQAAIEDTVPTDSRHTAFIDANRDNKLIQDLRNGGMNVREFKFTSNSKRGVIENLAVRLERGEIEYPEIPELLSELQAFEYDVTAGGNVRYQAPPGVHDDTVDSLALAAQEVENSASRVGVF